MARRPKGAPPSYCLHRQSGQACFNWPLGNGKYKTILLGKHGTPESHLEYERVLAEWRAAGKGAAPARTDGPQVADLTVYEVALQFRRYAEKRYVHADGRPTGEAENFADAMVQLLNLYGHSEAALFGPNALRAVRLAMVEAGLARKTVNARVNRVRRFFKWAVSRQLIPGTVYADLMTVEALRQGERVEVDGQEVVVAESPGVHDIPWERVDATMPFLPRPVAAMVQVLRYSNCRAEDVCVMRGVDLTMKGDVWEYRPESHKNMWRGQERVVLLGPRCQSIIRPFFKADLQGYLFSPAEARAEYQAKRAAARKTKRTPSETKRKRKANPKRAPRDHYDTNTFQQAVRKACRAANVPAWTVLEVRHTRGTEVRERYGVEGAAASLGNTVEAAQIYAEENRKLAREIAREIG
jgi:integrase